MKNSDETSTVQEHTDTLIEKTIFSSLMANPDNDDGDDFATILATHRAATAEWLAKSPAEQATWYTKTFMHPNPPQKKGEVASYGACSVDTEYEEEEESPRLVAKKSPQRNWTSLKTNDGGSREILAAASAEESPNLAAVQAEWEQKTPEEREAWLARMFGDGDGDGDEESWGAGEDGDVESESDHGEDVEYEHHHDDEEDER